MIRKKLLVAVILSVALAVTVAGNALAAFGNLSLIRVVLQQTGGTTEIATDLGNVTADLAGGTFGGGANAFTAQVGGTNFVAGSTGLNAVYFAVNQTTKELWITGVNPSISAGKSTIITSLTTNIFTYYNGLGGTTVLADASFANSYRVKADATTQFGQFGTAIVLADRPFTEANLEPLSSGGSVTQDLYYFANYAVAGDGVKVATVTTNSDGSTTISAVSAGDTTAPGVTITAAPVNSTSATVSISFTATDAVGVTAYQITESATPPASGDANWVAITASPSFGTTVPHTYSGVVPGVLTTKTLFVWAKDAAGNVSSVKSAATDITIPLLTVTTVDSNLGAGQVNSDVGVFTCVGATCTAPFDSAQIPGPVTLTALPDTNSFFSGWSNNASCVGTAPCILTMSSSQDVTATFDRLTLVQIPGVPSVFYGLVQNAFNAALNGDVIKTTQHTFVENPTFNNTISDVVKLMGGYDTLYTEPPTGISTIQGKLTIKSGKLIASRVAIK